MFDLATNVLSWESELKEEAAQFFPAGDAKVRIEHRFDSTLGKHAVCIDGTCFNDVGPYVPREPLSGVDVDKRNAKLAVYRSLSSYTGRSLPWGSLTGIRPTRLIYELTDAGVSTASACQTLRDVYAVSQQKTALLMRIVEAQKGAVVRDARLVNLYVHIPFCTSRCTYCSFVTEVVERRQAWIEPYVDALVTELEEGRKFLRAHGYRVYSVYVGGGTPTALSAKHLYRVLQAAAYPVEFTCEAGRPDTVTQEKLDAMRAAQVTRVSVNPQSLVPSTLEAIGRNHTVEQFFNAYRLVKEAGFSINTDLIAGLASETADDFRLTLDRIAALHPDNVTVHTLARKNGSALKESGTILSSDQVGVMTDYALEKLTACGYQPYYLYRQKRMLDNRENVGYTRPGSLCVNNVTTMEDCMSVFACGAGAISKRVYPSGGRIERLANLRDIQLYLNQFAARLNKKHDFFG